MKSRTHWPLRLLLLAFTGLSGCASVRPEALNSYTNSFSTVYSQAQDLYLRSEIVAENIADRPETEGSVSSRVKELEARKRALKARLDALDLVYRYNTVLSRLAAGESADNLKNQVTNLQQGLTSFDVAPITSLVQKAMPFLGILTQGVALVEDAIKKAKFRDAVNAAQRPIAAILDILLADADDLEEISVQELSRQQDPYRVQIDSFSRRFNSRIKELKSSPDMDALTEKINDARQSMNRTSTKPIKHQPSTTAADAVPADIDTLTALVGQVETCVINFNKLENQIKAQHSLLDTYRSTLSATKSTFIALSNDVESSRAVATHDFIKQALELKKAVLQLQEVK